jgi:L-alanine-DL-glutamate epimerase-like enolase superfamily enzyme
MRSASAPIERIEARAYRVPTDGPEADGTFSWDSTTIVIVELHASGATGLGYSYAAAAAVDVARGILAPAIRGDALAIERHWEAMVGAVRNIGWRGVAASAIAAVDTALWDLKARLLDVPLASLFGTARDAVPIYGSGGFTTYSYKQLAGQLGRWAAEDGCRWVKMKVGAEPERDGERMRIARDAIRRSRAHDRRQRCAFAQAGALFRRASRRDRRLLVRGARFKRRPEGLAALA